LKRQIKKELGDINRDIRRLRDPLDENDAYKQQTLAKFIRDKPSEEEKDEALRGAGTERVKLQGELLKLERKQTISEVSIERALGFMGSIHQALAQRSLGVEAGISRNGIPRGLRIRH